MRSRTGKEQNEKPTTLPAWQKNFIIGIDNCICSQKKSTSKLSARDVTQAAPVEGAKEWVNERFDDGHIICFFTSRSERLRGPTEAWLQSHGFKYHSLLMGKPNARQYHYIDDRHVQATTFGGKFSPLIKRDHKIQVFG